MVDEGEVVKSGKWLVLQETLTVYPGSHSKDELQSRCVASRYITRYQPTGQLDLMPSSSKRMDAAGLLRVCISSLDSNSSIGPAGPRTD